MILTPTTTTSLMLAAILCGAPSAVAGGAPGHAAAAACGAIRDGLRQVETKTLRAIAAIEAGLKEAEHLSEWYGGETVDAYIAVLHDRERLLHRTLDELRAANCTEASKPICCKPG